MSKLLAESRNADDLYWGCLSEDSICDVAAPAECFDRGELCVENARFHVPHRHITLDYRSLLLTQFLQETAEKPYRTRRPGFGIGLARCTPSAA